MEKAVKAVLYAYPMLKNVEQDYDEHIKNMAILSYRDDGDVERLVEKIGDEIVKKRLLMRLKGLTERVLARLSDVERTLIALRYFGKKRKINRPICTRKGFGAWNESKYFRMQNKLVRRMVSLFCLEGFTKEEFYTCFATMDLFEKLLTYLERDNRQKIGRNERAWLGIAEK